MMKVRSGLVLVVVAITAMGVGSVAPDREKGASGATPPLIALPRRTTAATDDTFERSLADARVLIDAGLSRLAESQNEDGSFGAESQVRLAVSAIATLSFLAGGNTENRGHYAGVVKKAVKFLMACSTREGERKGYFSTNTDTTSKMHGHGYATLALTQIYGEFGLKRKYTSTTTDLKAIIHDAVSVIDRSQSRNGGWNYEPFDRVEDEGSITVCMIHALRGARNCGFFVKKSTVDDAVEYVRRSQNSDGSIRYRLVGSGQSSFELTAAGCATLAYGSEYSSPAVRRARDYLWNQRFDEFLGRAAAYPYYGMFYAVQALQFDYDRDRMSRLFPRICDWFKSSWNPKSKEYDHGDLRLKEVEYGPIYRTAFATLTLQVPRSCLPIFQRSTPACPTESEPLPDTRLRSRQERSGSSDCRAKKFGLGH